MRRQLIVMGNGGHASVLMETIQLSDQAVILGCTSPSNESAMGCNPIRYLGTDDCILNYDRHAVSLVNGIGGNGTSNELRVRIYTDWSKQGYSFAEVWHPAAILSPSAEIGQGCQVMAGAVIGTGVRIGVNCLINTRAVIDHHCQIANHVHIAPGAVLCGQVSVGEGAHIGAGATIKQGVHIGAYAIVGAGAVVIRDVPERATVVGVPAKEVGG